MKSLIVQKNFLWMLSLILVMVMVVGVTVESEAKFVDISIGASPPGGSWYPMAIAIGDLLAKTYAEITDDQLRFSIGIAGGMGNVIAAHNGDLSFGFTDGSVANAGFDGQEPYEAELKNVRSIGVLEPSVYQYATLAAKDIYNMYDFKGKAVNAMPRGFGSEVANAQVLQALGMSYDDFSKVEYLGYSEAVSLLKDGRLDGILFATCAFPHAAIIELTTMRDARILGFTEEEIRKIKELQPSFTPFIIPAGSYRGQDEDVLTISDNEVIIANKDVPDEIAYAMAKAICENLETLKIVNASLEALTPELLSQEFGIPVHPGALKYYKEVGLVD